MSSKYSFGTTLWKGGKFILTFFLPYMVAAYFQFHPEVSALTIGAAATMAINYIKNYDK